KFHSRRYGCAGDPKYETVQRTRIHKDCVGCARDLWVHGIDRSNSPASNGLECSFEYADAVLQGGIGRLDGNRIAAGEVQFAGLAVSDVSGRILCGGSKSEFVASGDTRGRAGYDDLDSRGRVYCDLYAPGLSCIGSIGNCDRLGSLRVENDGEASGSTDKCH